eukprot:4702704-Amphidinium_carterae.1
MLDSGAEEHCAPASWKGWGQEVESQPVVLKGVDGKSIEQVGQEKFEFLVKNDDGVEIVVEAVFILCRGVEKFVLSVGKLSESGLECCFTRDPSLHVTSPRAARIPLRREGRVFLLPARVVTVRGIRAVGVEEVPQSERDPEARSSDAPAETDGGRAERELRSMQAEERFVQPGGPREERDTPQVVLGPAAKVREMRDRLRILRQPVYGTKEELYSRLLKAEAEEEMRRRERDWIEARSKELADHPPAREPPHHLRIPEMPDEKEVQAHLDRQHLPPAPWCVLCLAGRSAAAAHYRIPPPEVLAPRIEMDFNYYTENCNLMEAKTEAETKAWATTLTLVDKPSQNAIHVALPSKAVTEYPVKAASEFVRRMSYQKAELLTDGEPATQALAEEIRKRVLKDGVALRVIIAP